MAGFTNYQFNQGIFDYLTRKALIEYQSGQNPFLKEVLGFSPSDKMEANGIADVGLCRHIIKKTGYYSKLLIYQINYGDTLSAISGRFKIGVKDLILLNNITKEGFIKTGQKIFILIRPDSSLEKSYKIKAGESLEMIANRFQIPLDDLIKSNCLFISGTIKTGELLYIPGRPQDM
jgi:LysM repeat protein